MLWYLANGSLNQYLKSQIQLQGEYYSEQKTTLALADFSEQTNTAIFNQLSLENINSFQATDALGIDTIHVELAATQQNNSVTEISNITINKLTINIDKKDNTSNIEQLIKKISLKLANDYPQSYPAISAKIYAQNHPELNAEEFAKNHPQATPDIEQAKRKKSREKIQQKVIISVINIKNVTLNVTEAGVSQSIQKHNIKIESLGNTQGLLVNQLGGEILLSLLKLADH